MQLDGRVDWKIGMIRDSKISLGCDSLDIASLGGSAQLATPAVIEICITIHTVNVVIGVGFLEIS